MTDKIIKNEQWYVKILLQKIKNGEIYKPKVQRKKKWSVLPKKENKPSEKKYIQFLYSKQNSVHSITFGQIKGKFSNIDGNNRINAIAHFLNEPFALFPEYLIEIHAFIDTHFEHAEIQEELKEKIANMSYNDIMLFKYTTFLKDDNGNKLPYDDKLRLIRDEFEPYFEMLISRLKINNEDRFDTNVKININLFEGYSTDDLQKLFGEINTYDNKLTEIELLACRLFNIDDFEVNDSVIKSEVIVCIKEYYHKKSEDEILNCYLFDEKIEKMNAYDFMMGFQNYANNKCALIGKPDSEGLSLFFKIYRNIYKGGFDNSFTNENINDFIEKIKQVLTILELIYNDIFMEKLVAGGKILDACNKKLDSIKKNNAYLIIISIIGYINKSEDQKIIIKSIEKCILYHFFTNEISDSKIRESFELHDTIHHKAGGQFIEDKANKFYKNPELIIKDLTKDIMSNVLDKLLEENIKNNPYETRSNGKDKIDRRRSRKFHEKALMYYYYKTRIPTEFLKYTFWIEHIFPFSSSWQDHIDIDRFGNILPIIDEINGKRNNKHISEYKKYDKYGFIPYVSDVIPNNDIYDKIITHENKKPEIMNAKEFNDLCQKNEQIYKTTFINYLFS